MNTDKLYDEIRRLEEKIEKLDCELKNLESKLEKFGILRKEK